MKIDYIQDKAKRYSFERPNLKKWVESHCQGKVLNLFAGRTKLDIEELRIDNHEKAEADIYIDAMEFIKTTNEKFDTIIIDPPIKIKNKRIKFKDRYEYEIEIYKNAILNIISDDGIVISIGKDSIGMTNERGFEKTNLCIVYHQAGHEDLIALIEKKKASKLYSFF